MVSRPSIAWWSAARAAKPASSGCRPIAATASGRRGSKGVWPEALVKAALCRSSTLAPASATFTDTFPTLEQMRALVPDPVAYHYQHRDGLRCTMLLMNGLVRDFTFAAAIEGQAKPFSTQMYLPMPDGRTTLASFFSPLVYNAEQMFLTGKAQYPIERTLLTSGLLIAGVDSAIPGHEAPTDAKPGGRTLPAQP